MGYDVFPMAVSCGTIFAIGPSSDANQCSVHHMNKDKYTPLTFSVAAEKDITLGSTFHFTHYIKAGIKGALQHLKLDKSDAFNVVVSDNLFKGAGLSSSSSLVVASAVATIA